MLQKTRSKKGFTLAELLIVVAIIAVLTAIAVPLFVGAVNKAEEATGAANVRAVRGAAVTTILSDQTKYMSDNCDYDTIKDGEDGTHKGETNFVWYATADITVNGEMTIKIINTEPTSGDYANAYKKGGYEKQSNNSYKVAIKLTELTIA